jgi:hypothetical protein
MLVARPTTLSGVSDVDALPALAAAARNVGSPQIRNAGVLVAIRQATGLPLNRIPVRPDDIALSAEPAASTG